MKNYKIVKLTNITQTTLCGIEPNVTIGIWNNRIFVSAYKWEIKDHIINGDFICHDAEYIEVNIHDALCDIDDMIQDTFRIASDESFNIEVGKVIVNRFKEDAIKHGVDHRVSPIVFAKMQSVFDLLMAGMFIEANEELQKLPNDNLLTQDVKNSYSQLISCSNAIVTNIDTPLDTGIDSIAGTYKQVEVDMYGRIKSGSNPDTNIADVNGLQDALNAKVNNSAIGQNNGIASLDATGRVPSTQLPSYVDDVIIFASYSNLPTTGEDGKIYITIDSNLTYRWNGSGYTEISPSLALGETSSTAYRGDRGKAAYDHSQTSGNPHGTDFSELENKPNTLAGYGITDVSINDISGLQDVLNSKADDIDLDEYLPLIGGNLEGDLSIKSNTNSRLLGFIVPIDGYRSSSRNAISFRHDKNELAYARLKGYTITETGSKVFGNAVDNFFNERGTYNNIYDSNNPNSDYSIEITPTNQFNNSANTAWRIIVSFHNSPAFSNLTVDIKNGVDLWTTVYDGYPTSTDVFMYNFTLTNGGAIKSVKFTFTNITGNTYINHLGIEGQLSSLESQWYVNRLGGDVYGNINAYNLLVNNKQVATREWTTSQDYITKTISDSLYLESTLKGIPDGIAELDSTGRVPSNQLPSYVDDVVVVESYSSLPTTGENGKIYITLDTNLTYRWNGSGYTEISPSLALGETASTAYRGDRGKTAYDHSQVMGNPHGTDFSELENLPTTLEGYGITDATIRRGVNVSASAGWYRLGYVDMPTGGFGRVFGSVRCYGRRISTELAFSVTRLPNANTLETEVLADTSCTPSSVQWEVLGDGTTIRLSFYIQSITVNHAAFVLYDLGGSGGALMNNAHTHEYVGATKPANTELVNCLDRVTLTDASASSTLPTGNMVQSAAIQWLRNNIKQLQSTAIQNGVVTTQDWNSFTSIGVFNVANWSGANGPVVDGVPSYKWGQLVVEQFGNTVTQIYYPQQDTAPCFRQALDGGGFVSWRDLGAGIKDFSELENKPTTLSGYGITDGAERYHAFFDPSFFGEGTTSLYGHVRKAQYMTIDGNDVVPSSLMYQNVVQRFHMASVGAGTAGWLKVCSLTCVGGYTNEPITITLSRRGANKTCRLTIRFQSTNNLTPYVELANYEGQSYGVYYHKRVEGTYDIYVNKAEPHDRCHITEFKSPYNIQLNAENGTVATPPEGSIAFKQAPSDYSKTGRLTSEDWNSFTESGIYNVAGWSGANGPTVNGVQAYKWGFLVVEAFQNTVIQTYYPHQAGMPYYRQSWEGGAFVGWSTSPKVGSGLSPSTPIHYQSISASRTDNNAIYLCY